MSEFIQIMFWPFMACLVLTAIHAYLGFHVIQRGVIFADLALAQIAALGTGVGMVLGHQSASCDHGYGFSIGFTVVGAAIFALTRFRKQLIPQEALIGIVYVVASALLVLVMNSSGEGAEHIRDMLVGNILLTSSADVQKLLGTYTVIGGVLYLLHDTLSRISRNPQEAFDAGVRVRLWDFVFYVMFGIVVTSSVKIAGVLLVFTFLVIPAACAMMFSDRPVTRLWLGWGIGSAASLVGMAVSYYGDFPTGAATVVVFGVFMVSCLVLKYLLFKG